MQKPPSFSISEASTKMSRDSPPSILFFDILGTIVEWRFCITNELQTAAQKALQGQTRDLSADMRARVSSMPTSSWQEIAEEWHRSYMNFGNTYDPSKPFVSVDEYNRISLGSILSKWLLRGLFNEHDLENLTLAWHRLDSYSDSVPGLSLLNTRFSTSTLSNGNVKLLEDLQGHNSLPFEYITSAEHFGAYKPAPEVYHGAARKFGFETSQCCLVAAHLEDLRAAKKCGFQTIYLERELEEAWDSRDIARARQDGFVDLWVEVGGSGLIEVARHFGIEREL
jgi:2-haloacid dehalogenase